MSNRAAGPVFLAIVLFASLASAQTPAAPTPAPLSDTLTSAPIIGQRGVTLVAGGTLQDGRTNQREWTLDGIVAHTTGRNTLLRLEASMDITQQRPPADATFTEIEDNHLLTALAMHPLSARYSIVGLAGWRRDAILGLSHRINVGGGIGVHLLDAPHVSATVIPIFVLGDEARTHTDYGDAVADIGVIQTLAVRLNERVIVEESFKANIDTGALDDHTVRLDASLQSQIVSRTSLKVYVEMVRDAVAPPGLDRLQTKTGIALQVTFARPR